MNDSDIGPRKRRKLLISPSLTWVRLAKEGYIITNCNFKLVLKAKDKVREKEEDRTANSRDETRVLKNIFPPPLDPRDQKRCTLVYYCQIWWDPSQKKNQTTKKQQQKIITSSVHHAPLSACVTQSPLPTAFRTWANYLNVVRFTFLSLATEPKWQRIRQIIINSNKKSERK